jgi:hypothetical protein
MRSTTDPAVERELAALDAALDNRPLPAEHADLATLVRAVRADAAPLPPHLTRRLDDLTADRPARPPRSWLVAGAGATAIGGLVAVILVSGAVRTTHPRQTLVAPATGTTTVEHAAPTAGAAARPAPAEILPPAPGATPTPGAGPRQVERNASVTLAAPSGHVRDVADRVISTTDGFGGIVQSSNVTTGDQGADAAQLELQIPTARLNQLLAALSRLAHVSSRNEGSVDVTDSIRVARDRLTAARAERRALLRQLAGASTPNQVASIRAQLALVAEQINRDQAGLAGLSRRTQDSSVSVTVEDPRTTGVASPDGGRWTLGDAAGDALRVLEVALGATLIGLAGLVPVLALGLAAWRGAGIVRRRRRAQALA